MKKGKEEEELGGGERRGRICFLNSGPVFNSSLSLTRGDMVQKLYPAGFGLVSLHNCMCQFIKINVSVCIDLPQLLMVLQPNKPILS